MRSYSRPRGSTATARAAVLSDPREVVFMQIDEASRITSLDDEISSDILEWKQKSSRRAKDGARTTGKAIRSYDFGAKRSAVIPDAREASDWEPRASPAF